jgi:hypothetical protein
MGLPTSPGCTVPLGELHGRAAPGPPLRHPLSNQRRTSPPRRSRCGGAPEPHAAHEPPPRDLLDHRHAHPGGKAGAPHAAGESATASPVHPPSQQPDCCRESPSDPGFGLQGAPRR